MTRNEPLKILDVLFENQNAEFFSTFDFPEGFHQVEVAENGREYLRFHFEGRTYVYNRLPFGTSISL